MRLLPVKKCLAATTESCFMSTYGVSKKTTPLIFLHDTLKFLFKSVDISDNKCTADGLLNLIFEFVLSLNILC